jgi:tellurite resistance protein TerC
MLMDRTRDGAWLRRRQRRTPRADPVTFLVYGTTLIATAVQLFHHRDQDPQIEYNLIVRLAHRTLPTYDRYDEGRNHTRRDGRRIVTPLFPALLTIGSSDLLFASGSIPAVLGVTDHAYIVLAANAFALLGLRPLFLLDSGLLDRLVYMSAGLALNPRRHRPQACP